MYVIICIPIISSAQNVGIGVTNPLRGKLEVASPAGNITIASFGNAGAAGISIDDNNPLIGFNNYRNVTRKFMSSTLGYGAILYFESSIGRLRYNMAANRGTQDQDLSNYQSFWTIDSTGNMGLGTIVPSEAKLQIHEPAGNTQFIAAAGSNLPGISTFVPISSPSIGYNMRYQGGYKFMGTGYAGMWQYSPSEGKLNYFYSSTKGLADGTASPVFAITIDSSGNLGIGNSVPKAQLHATGNVVFGSSSVVPAVGYKLSVDGKVICEELKVQTSASWPDYVFDDNYRLPALIDLQDRVSLQKHLPGIPSASEVYNQKGIEVGEMQRKMLEKLEEAYLYIFELNQKNLDLEKRLAAMERSIKPCKVR